MLHGYGVSLLHGAAITLAVALCSLALAVLLGLAGALAKLSRSVFWRRAAAVYTTLVRGVPDLVLMLLVFYGGQLAVNRIAPWLGAADYVDVDPFAAGVLTIGFIFGAYMTETFRGAIIAIPRGQAEAGLACGMSREQVLWRIVLPQMVRLAIPSFANNWLVLVKSTALLSLIGLADVMQRAGQAAGNTRQPFTFFLAAAGFYLAITSVSVWLLRRLEARTSQGVRALRR